MKRNLLVLSFIWLLACDSSAPPENIELRLGAQKIQAELALTKNEWRQGLMYREHLPPATGMLFVANTERPRSFWMKNTYLSLDIIYLDSKLQVVSLVENTTPLSEASIPSRRPARFVLELKAGEAHRLGITTGTQLHSDVDLLSFKSEVD